MLHGVAAVYSIYGNKQWSDKSMISAVNGGISVQLVSDLHNVPNSILQDCIKSQGKGGRRAGPPAYLTATEEELIKVSIVS